MEEKKRGAQTAKKTQVEEASTKRRILWCSLAQFQIATLRRCFPPVPLIARCFVESPKLSNYQEEPKGAGRAF